MRFPVTIGHRAVAEAGHQATVAGVISICPIEFGAETKVFLPVHQLDGIGDRALGFEFYDARIERCIRHRIDSDEGAIYIKFEIVISEDIAGDHLTIGIDNDGRHSGDRSRCGSDVSRRDAGDFVVEIACFICRRKLSGSRNRPHRAVGGGDAAHTADALAGGEKISRGGGGATLADRGGGHGAHSEHRIGRGVGFVTDDTLGIPRWRCRGVDAEIH